MGLGDFAIGFEIFDGCLILIIQTGKGRGRLKRIISRGE
jgi:hypothetical protein